MAERSGFGALWSAHTAAVVGTNTSLVVIPLLALETVGAGVLQMSILEATESLAVLLFGLFIGIAADGLGGHRAMLLAHAVRAAALLSLPVAYFWFTLTFVHVFVVVFVVGLGTLLYHSALSKSVVTQFPRNRWTRINAYLQGSDSVSEVAGPGLGGLLVQWVTAPLAVLFDAACYLVGMVLLAVRRRRVPDPLDDGRLAEAARARDNCPDPEPCRGEAPEGAGRQVRGALAGLRRILGQPVLRSITFAAAQFNFFTAMFYGIYTYFLVRVLEFPPLLVGLASVAGGVGGVLATVSVDRLTRRLPTAVIFAASLLVPGAVAFLVPLAQGAESRPGAFALVAVSQAAWSFAVVVNLVMSETIKQLLTDAGSIGTVSAVIRWITLGVEPAGALLGGVAATAFGTMPVLLAAAVGLLTSPVWLGARDGIRSFDLRGQPAGTA